MGLKKDLIIGLALLSIVVLFVGAIIGLFLLTQKAVGVLLIIFGIFLLTSFSDVMGPAEYQTKSMTTKGLLIGFVAIIIGVLLIIF